MEEGGKATLIARLAVNTAMWQRYEDWISGVECGGSGGTEEVRSGGKAKRPLWAALVASAMADTRTLQSSRLPVSALEKGLLGALT